MTYTVDSAIKLWRHTADALEHYLSEVIARVNDVPEAFVRTLGRYIARATPVYWDFKLFEASSAGSETFVGTRAHAHERFDPPYQFWVWDRDLDPMGRAPEGFSHRCILLLKGQGPMAGSDENSLMFVKVHQLGTERLGISADELQEMERKHGIDAFAPRITLHHIHLDGLIHDSADAEIIAAIQFMQLSVVELEPHKHSRQVRRAAERQNIQLPDIRIVKLRRSGYISRHDNHETETVEWNYQWLVRGHWRQQWYPSENVHKPKYILPYVKGPEDKPLKPSTTTVFAVVR